MPRVKRPGNEGSDARMRYYIRGEHHANAEEDYFVFKQSM